MTFSSFAVSPANTSQLSAVLFHLGVHLVHTRQRPGVYLVVQPQTCAMTLDHDHDHVLVEARSCIAALADAATTFDQSVAYDGLLLRLDQLHGDDAPACEPMSGVGRNELLLRAEGAIESLVEFGIDALSSELLLADLQDASMLD